jgi:hypothetical protein
VESGQSSCLVATIFDIALISKLTIQKPFSSLKLDFHILPN